VLGLVVAVQLALVWAHEYPPTADGPAHVANAAILKDYNHPDAAAWRRFYALSDRADPNLAGHYLMAVLMHVVSPVTAEKILLSLYVVALPLAFAYALRAVRPDATWATFLVLPFTFSYVVNMGFYNFSLSLPGYFVIVGYWLRHRDHFDAVYGARLLVMMLALYCCHIVSLLLGWITIAVLAAWTIGGDLLAARKQDQRTPGVLWRAIRCRALIPLLASLPALALMVSFVKRHHEPKIVGRSKLELLASLLDLDALVSFSDDHVALTRWFTFVLIAAGALVVGLRIARRRRLEWSDGLLAVAAVMGALYLKAGEQAYLPARLSLFVFLPTILWLGVQIWPRWGARSLQLIGGGTALAMVLLSAPYWAKLSDQIAEYLSVAGEIRPGSTLLSLPQSRLGWSAGGDLNDRIHTFLYTSGYFVPARRIVDLRNYEAHMGYFPVDYRKELSPYVHMAQAAPPRPRWHGSELWPPQIDLDGYERATGATVDGVLLWGKLDDIRREAPALMDMLESRYRLVTSSKPNQLAHVWERKTPPPTTATSRP
jgi:hypothetical protein